MSLQRRIYYFRFFVLRGELKSCSEEKKSGSRGKSSADLLPRLRFLIRFIYALCNDDRHDNFDRRSL